MTEAGGQNFAMENIFDSFTKVSTFSYNEYTVPLWKQAVEDYEAWRSRFDQIALVLQDAGSKSVSVFGNVDDYNKVLVMLRFSSALIRCPVFEFQS